MTSTVPAVIAALIALAKSAMPAGTNIIDGEPLRGQPGDFIAIGHSSTGPSVENVQSISDFGIVSSHEDYVVAIEVVAWHGLPNLAPLRVRAYALLDILAAAIAADSRLGGHCMLAQLIHTGTTQAQPTEGAMVVLSASVRVQAART